MSLVQRLALMRLLLGRGSSDVGGKPPRRSVRGLVSSEPEESENGLSAVEVEIQAGTWVGDRVQVARLQVSDLYLGDQISIVGLSGNDEVAAVLTPAGSCRVAVRPSPPG